MLRIEALAHGGGQCSARSHFLPRGRIDAMGAARRHISVASASLKITPAAATGSYLTIAYHHTRALLYPYMCGGPREYNCARSRARCAVMLAGGARRRGPADADLEVPPILRRNTRVLKEYQFLSFFGEVWQCRTTVKCTPGKTCRPSFMAVKPHLQHFTIVKCHPTALQYREVQ